VSEPRAPEIAATPDRARPRIALFTTKMEGGGIQRVLATLARAFLARGIAVDVLLVSRRGELLGELPREARVLEMRSAWPIAAGALLALPGARRVAWGWLATLRPRPAESVAPLARYLARERPDALLASPMSASLAALWAAHRAHSSVRVVAREANTLSRQIAQRSEWYHARLPALAREWYPRAASVIAVSRGVADDLARLAGLPRERIAVIHSPVDAEAIRARAAEAAPDDWLAPGQPPVVLGVGRLAPAKDFATLLRAFALLRAQRPARLILLGEGPERTRLAVLARQLGVAQDVRLRGFEPNPFAFMARAGVLASSSRYEGLANVLREALVCRCPVVATDCPSGSAEALGDGALGQLVPVGDSRALAAALAQTLAAPPSREERERRARLVATEDGVERYLRVLLGRDPAQS
jgi:glycosyltransferase involved in cell wall biosynthesis